MFRACPAEGSSLSTKGEIRVALSAVSCPKTAVLNQTAHRARMPLPSLTQPAADLVFTKLFRLKILSLDKFNNVDTVCAVETQEVNSAWQI